MMERDHGSKYGKEELRRHKARLEQELEEVNSRLEEIEAEQVNTRQQIDIRTAHIDSKKQELKRLGGKFS